MNDIRLEQLNQSTKRVGLQERGQNIALQKAAEAEKAKNIRAGLRPIDTAMSTSPGGRLPSKSVMGAYGQMYVPDNTMIDLAARKAAATAQATTPVMVDRAKQVADYRQKLAGSEATPMAADTAGRYTFANESLRNLPKVKGLLFKDGKFNQALVNKAIAGKYTKDADVQSLKRWVTGTLTARGLIQSGTVIKDDEWVRLAQQYGIDLFSAPEAALSALNEQESFFDEFMTNIRPQRNKGKASGNVEFENLAKQKGVTIRFKS
jgi:hypothetical protein